MEDLEKDIYCDELDDDELIPILESLPQENDTAEFLVGYLNNI